MSQVCVILFVLFKFSTVNGYPGESVMFMPPHETRTVDKYPMTSELQVNSHRPTQIVHTNDERRLAQPLWNNLSHKSDFKDLIEAFNDIQTHQEEGGPSQSHTALHVGHDNSDSAYRSYPVPYLLPSSNENGPSQTYRKPFSPAIAPDSFLPKAASLKPEVPSLFKPVTTKVASKGSGLLSLLLGMFSGSSSSGLLMKGLPELVIKGIMKPLLDTKRGMKPLMSQLSIPLIALVLINLEVFVIIWWLWEDCEPPIIPPPIYPPTYTPTYPQTYSPTYSSTYPNIKPAYKYNKISSYR